MARDEGGKRRRRASKCSSCTPSRDNEDRQKGLGRREKSTILIGEKWEHSIVNPREGGTIGSSPCRARAERKRDSRSPAPATPRFPFRGYSPPLLSTRYNRTAYFISSPLCRTENLTNGPSPPAAPYTRVLASRWRSIHEALRPPLFLSLSSSLSFNTTRNICTFVT